MGNAYKDFRDDVVEGMMDSAINRLKNPGGIKPLGYRDFAKPTLNYQAGVPAKIQPVSKSHKRLTISGMPK